MGHMRVATVRRMLSRVVATAVVIGLGVAASPVAASAAPDPQWWCSFYNVDALQAQGLSGEGQRIAVIDGQINPDLPVFAGGESDGRAGCVVCGEVGGDF
jgi:hypothetical protein